MARTPTINQITVKNQLYYLEDTEARQQNADVPNLRTDVTALQSNVNTLQNNRVLRAGDTMTGDLNFNAGKKIRLNGGSSSYGIVKQETNYQFIEVFDSDGESRGLRIKAPNSQATDFLALEYYSKIGGATKTYEVDTTFFTTFTGTALTVEGNHEYANATAISSLTITWPTSMQRGFIFGVNFTASGSFTGVTHKTAANKVFTPLLIGNKSDQPSKRYNLIGWCDGSSRWCTVLSCDM